MAENLLTKWPSIDSAELMILLQARIGSGQFLNRADSPNKLCLPLAADKCRVILTFKDDRIVSVEAGLAFDRAE